MTSSLDAPPVMQIRALPRISPAPPPPNECLNLGLISNIAPAALAFLTIYVGRAWRSGHLDPTTVTGGWGAPSSLARLARAVLRKSCHRMAVSQL
ncbi:hypothetical protein [Glaciimonas immobilis]|uniref:Uncharacterized protein n=1 Tax=Glaciimonas immobilis TaxID=728004 RepID=A0A840RKP5_9BURK|nr:hypothetical protein [Glaciimonas immobilis]KAF3999325.1 hypothetical protein HAV38_05185 [Glaciimonas immobilis]MBB5198807.1 hypothetical protein [Glaciimonas immobilis]